MIRFTSLGLFFVAVMLAEPKVESTRLALPYFFALIAGSWIITKATP